MNTPQKTSSPKRQAESEPSTNDTNIDLLNTEMLQQVIALLKPLLEFHKVDEDLTKDDVKIYWNVRAIRGKDQAFANLQGSCTMHQMFAPHKIVNAPSRAEQELVDKITLPMVAIFQSEVQRVALEEGAPYRDGLADRGQR